MTKTPNEYNLLQEDSPQSYAIEKQNEFVRLLQTAFEHGKLDELNYRRLSLDFFNGLTWNDVFDYFENLYKELITLLRGFEINAIQKRIVRGAEMIENETDPVKRRQYLGVYDQLLKKLESLKDDE